MEFAQNINPVKFLLSVHGVNLTTVKYDPIHEGQYKIIRQHTHDGLLLYRQWLATEVLKNICDNTSFYKPIGSQEPDWDKIDYIEYTIGDIKIEVEVNIPEGEKWWLTMRERATMPVSCEYVMKV